MFLTSTHKICVLPLIDCEYEKYAETHPHRGDAKAELIINEKRWEFAEEQYGSQTEEEPGVKNISWRLNSIVFLGDATEKISPENGIMK